MEEDLVGCTEGGDGGEEVVSEPVTVITRGNGGGPREAVAYHAIHDDLEQLQSLPRRSRRIDVDCHIETQWSNRVELRARVRRPLHTVRYVRRWRRRVHIVRRDRSRRREVVEAEPSRLLTLRSSDDAWIGRALRALNVTQKWSPRTRLKCQRSSRSGPRQGQGHCCCRDPNQPLHLHKTLPSLADWLLARAAYLHEASAAAHRHRRA